MLDLRVLTYFLMVCETENISRAAERLHLTQPTLTRQIQELETELGVTLFTRGKRKTVLTEEGRLLKKRAEEIKTLVEKTEGEVSRAAGLLEGDVRIGCAETDAMREVARVIARVTARHPGLRFRLTSGNEEAVREGVDRGLLDFGVLVAPSRLSEYDFLKLSGVDVWGVLMRKGSPLSQLHEIRAENLAGVPLIASRQALANRELDAWFSSVKENLDLRADYNLVFNASLLVEEGAGCALALDRIVRTSDYASPLTFRPLAPRVTAPVYCIWQRQQIFSRAALYFREELETEIRNAECGIRN